MSLRERVIILPDGTFAASKEGANVLNARLDEFAFNARFANVGMAIGRTVQMNFTNSFGRPTSRTVNFSRTFGDHPPILLFGWTRPRGSSGYFFPHRIEGVTDNGSEEVINAEVQMNRVTFTSWFRPNNTYGKPTVRFRAFI